MDKRLKCASFAGALIALGIVYGDIGTSPLYVFASTFPDGVKNTEDILGVLSLILYTLTLIPLLKYVLIVLHANDNGQGKNQELFLQFAIYIYIYNF